MDETLGKFLDNEEWGKEYNMHLEGSYSLFSLSGLHSIAMYKVIGISHCVGPSGNSKRDLSMNSLAKIRSIVYKNSFSNISKL